MDSPDADIAALERTYARFRMVNTVVAGWRRIYRRDIRPRAQARPLRLLDIGCGGADIDRMLLGWARRDGIRLEIVGIDPDPRAIAWAQAHSPSESLTLRRAVSGELDGEQFDLVSSNHVLHHLDQRELRELLVDSARLVRPDGLVLHADLARSATAYRAFAAATLLLAPVLAGSFIRGDGLTSIRRAYTADELASAVPSGWSVRRAFPARLELRREGGDVG